MRERPKTTFFRFMLTIFLISSLTLVSTIQLVGWKDYSVIKDGRALQNQNTSEPMNEESFGGSTKIPGVEGAFAVVTTDDNGGVYVAYQSHWEENNNQSLSYHVYFAYSHDYGKTWSKSYRVDDNGSSSVWCDSPNIALDKNNGHIFIAWKDNRTGEAKLYIDKSTDRGVSFGFDVTVYEWPNDYFPPWLPYTANIEIDIDGKIYITWIAYYSDGYTDRDIFFAHSTDGGITFTTPVIINSPEGDVILAHPWIAIESTDVVYVVYTRRNSTQANVYLVKSQDGGSSFGSPVKVNDGLSQRYCGGTQVIVSSDGKIHVIWDDNREGIGPQYLDIYYAISSDGGLTFGPNIRVNDDNVISPPDIHTSFTRGVQGTPTMAIDSESVVHILWEDFRNFVSDTAYCRDIYYASSSDHIQFSTNLKVNSVLPDVDSVNCADPNSVFDSQDNFFIVYSDAPSGDNNYHYIYFLSVLSETEESSETSSSAFSFPLILEVTALFCVIFFIRKRS
ncbi:MAG: sialidase family protein [Candidatus Kariarchaeaceae archaeon]